jgi:hypothetical protein
MKTDEVREKDEKRKGDLEKEKSVRFFLSSDSFLFFLQPLLPRTTLVCRSIIYWQIRETSLQV